MGLISELVKEFTLAIVSKDAIVEIAGLASAIHGKLAAEHALPVSDGFRNRMFGCQLRRRMQ